MCSLSSKLANISIPNINKPPLRKRKTMKPTTRILSLTLIITLLAACTPAQTVAPTASATPAPTATITLTPTVTPSPAPTQTPTQVGPEMGAEVQEYLNGFESYDVVEVDGVNSIVVTYGGQEYKVMVEENGVWVRNYDDMAKFVNEDGSFNMEAAEVFSFGVEESVDDQGRKVISINQADYDAYKAEMIKTYEETMDQSQLGVTDAESAANGNYATLTGERELLLNFTEETLPRLIGLAGNGVFRVATLGTGNGVVMIVYPGGEGLGFKEGSYNLDSVEQVMTRIAGGNETVGQILFRCLMTSESVNPEPQYTLGSPETEQIWRALARGYGLSFEEFVEMVGDPFSWGPKADTQVIKALLGWPQPVPVYEANFRNEEGK